MKRICSYRGRLIAGGLFCFLLTALLLAAWPRASAAKDEAVSGSDKELRMALARLEALKKKQPPDLDALQFEYLVLFENFMRREEGKRSMFELADMWRQNKRWTDAYAALQKVLDVYQDHETMANPVHESEPLAIVATAKVEVADLYAKGMNNPYVAIEMLQKAMLLHGEQTVGLFIGERRYAGPLGAIARLRIAEYHLQTDGVNQASTELLKVVKDYPGKRVIDQGGEMAAATAAVVRLGDVLKKMPASLAKKNQTIQTFEQTAVEDEPRVWLHFLAADTYFAAYEQWKNAGVVESGIGKLNWVLDNHPLLPLTGERGVEPAGVRALRSIRDALLLLPKNVEQARTDLTAYQNRFAQKNETRVIAAYALLYLAELELDFRQNAASAYRLFMQAAEEYGDLEDYPHAADVTPRLKDRALRWAERAKQRM
ncbi:MAG TPA: hypothetical protein PKW95_02735 [bacterium]|nr:hypothetical protein [bacterium]